MMKMINSIFNWESSYFGGYERVVYDHPFVYIPYNIVLKYTKPVGIPYYVSAKLADIFLLKVMHHNLFKHLHVNSKTEVRKSFFGREEKVTVFNTKSIATCAALLSTIDSELSNLFDHYKKELSTLSIEYTHKDNKEKDVKMVSSGGTSLSEMVNDFKSCKAREFFYSKGGGNISGDLKHDTEFVYADEHEIPWYPNSEQSKQADAIVRLLDISFDPKEDKIENLKCGKMSAHKIAEIPAGNTHVYHRVENDQNTKPFSICILADESGSMTGNLFNQQHHLLKVLYAAFSQILPQDKIYIYGHTGEQTPVIHIYHDKYKTAFPKTIHSQLNIELRENYDGPVLESIYDRIRSQTSDNIIFISLSDGEPAGENYGGEEAIDELKRVIEKCKRDGFVTLGIGLCYSRVKDIYNYHTVIKKMDQLVPNVSALINRVVKTEFKS